MRSNWSALGLLAGIVMLGTGASPQGVVQAREWQREGDLASAGGLYEVAYVAYEKVAKTFPGTRHGRYAASRARAMQAALRQPARSPASEDARCWSADVVDFFLWP